MNTNLSLKNLEARRFKQALTIGLTLLLVGCTTSGSQEQGETASADVTQAGDSSSEASAGDDAIESTEAAAGESATTEAAPADAGTLTDAQTPPTDPAAAAAAAAESAGTDTNPAATTSSDGLAATDGATPDAAAATIAPETPATATLPDAGSDATAATAEGVGAGTAAGADAAAATGEALTQDSSATETPATETQAATQEASGTSTDVTAPVVAKPSESNVMEATIDRDQQRRDYTFGTRLFGSSRMQLAVNHPKFNEGQKGYETLYGKEKDYPTFTVDWFPADWWVNPGLSVSMGGYSVTGMAAIKGSDPDTIVADPNSQTTLLFVPLQASFKVEMTPFRQKWIVFDGWFGYEYGWWQETTSTASSVPTLIGAMASGSSSTDTSKPTSKGVKSATVFGASAHILLNSLDERSVRSMIATMGLSHVYLTPFFETVKTINKSGLTFGRNIYGIGFTFESLR